MRAAATVAACSWVESESAMIVLYPVSQYAIQQTDWPSDVKLTTILTTKAARRDSLIFMEGIKPTVWFFVEPT
jgi:hypothetical protein